MTMTEKLSAYWTHGVAYVSLLLAAGLSIAGNVADTYRVRGAAAVDNLDLAMAAFWPVLVLLAVEMFVSRRWDGQAWPMQALRWVGSMAIGGMAMRVSWVHLHDLMLWRGQETDVAILGPLAIDAMAIMATALIVAGRAASAKRRDTADPDKAPTYADVMARQDQVLVDNMMAAVATASRAPQDIDLEAIVSKYVQPGPSQLDLELARVMAEDAELPAARPAATSTRSRGITPDLADEIGDLVLTGLAHRIPVGTIDALIAGYAEVSTRTARRFRESRGLVPVSAPPAPSPAVVPDATDAS